VSAGEGKERTVTLVDTSVWINHLREGNDELRRLLNDNEVLCHPFIIGELACGTMKNRLEVLDLLRALPQSMVAEHDEVVEFVNDRKLYGQGLGWIDVHLLASASLSKVAIWTTDLALKRATDRLRKSAG
jgi:predicted nucleic acid-binding protein